MPTQSTLGTREGIMVRQLGDEVVALDTVESQVHQLNQTAALIWQLKHSGESEPAIAEYLSSAYEVDRVEALKDVVTIITQMRAKGLLPA
jgi:hypothetical protein